MEQSQAERFEKQQSTVQEKYGDLLYLEHPTSRRHKRMSMQDRAAQFAPFAALTGHGAAMKETALRTELEVEWKQNENRKK